jgi:hypothetical protein
MLATLLTFILFTSYSLNAFSEESSVRASNIHFAGFVFTGAYQDLNSNFENTLALNISGQIDQAIKARIQAGKSANLDIKYGLADLKKGESLVLAIALDREFISKETYKIDGKLRTKVIADVTAQVLLIDFSNLVIEASLPVSGWHSDLLHGDAALSKEYRKSLIKKLYFEPYNDEPSFIHKLADAALTVKPDKIGKTRVGVKSIEVSEEASAVFPENRSAEQVKHYFGSVATAKIAEKSDIQIVPYSLDYAVSGQMAARFSDGKVYNLKLPTPNLVLELNVQKFKKATFNQLVYTSYVQVKLASAIRGHIYINDVFRQWVTKDEGETIDDWPAYEDSIEVLLSDLAEQLISPSRSWFSEHAKENTKTFKQFKSTRKYFKNET